MTYLPFEQVKPQKSFDYYLYWFFSFLFLPIMLPLKLLSFIICCISLQLFSLFFMHIEPNKERNRFLCFLVEKVQQFNSRWFTFSLGYFYYRKSKTYKPRKFERVIVSNHISSLDPVFLIACGVYSFLSKQDVSEMPVFGVASKSLQCIFIDRKTGGAQKAMKECEERVKNNKLPKLCIFPEGTTTNEKAMMEFKPGAFELGKSVSMVFLRYNNKYMDPSDSSVSMAKAALKQFLGLYEVVELDYLGDYVPSKEELENPPLYAQNVEKKYLEYSKEEVSKMTVFDKFFYRGVEPERFTYEKTSPEFKEWYIENLRDPQNKNE